MAVTSVAYNGDGATVDFDITFDYTSISFVKAYVNGVLTTGWSFLDADTARFTVAPPVGVANVELRRETSTTPLVDFVASATITDTSLDLAILQQLHILEEIENNSLVGMQQSGGNWDATSDRIVNVSTPLAATDAANKDYVDDVIGSVADAEAAQAGAEAAEAGALAQAAAAAASAAASAASAVASANSAAAADASADSISSVYPISGMTTNYVLKAAGAVDVDAVRAELKQFISTAAMSGANAIVALTGNYSEYELVVEDFQPATNNVSLDAVLSVDNGATYRTGGSDYAFIVNGANSGGAANSGSNSTNAMTFTPASLPNTTPKTRRLHMRIVMGDGTLNTMITGHGGVQRNGGGHTAIAFSAELIGVATRPSHIRLQFSSGNITAGNVLLYGISR